MDNPAIDEYLEGAPEPQRSTLATLRTMLRAILPQGEESISYGMPVFKVDGKAVAGYAYFKNHCSYFPHSSSVLPQVAEELKDYKWSKGALQFAVDRPLPEPLVRRLVAIRQAEPGA